VPRSSAFGVLEVKRSNYSEIDDKLDEFTAAVADKKLTSDPGGSVEDYRRPAGLSVVCVLESPPSARLQKMVDAEQAVAIFEQIGGNTNIRSRDVIRLVNFLHYITWRYRVLGSRIPANPD